MNRIDQLLISATGIPLVVSLVFNDQEAAAILGLAPSFALLLWFFYNKAPFGKEIVDNFTKKYL